MKRDRIVSVQQIYRTGSKKEKAMSAPVLLCEPIVWALSSSPETGLGKPVVARSEISLNSFWTRADLCFIMEVCTVIMLFPMLYE